MNSKRLAIFFATSGHSGVDRIARNLVPAFVAAGLEVDVLRIRNHGPHLEATSDAVRMIDLGTSHTYSSLGPLVRYLRRERPAALLSDKDRVNRVALLARKLAGVDTRVAVRTGTTVSEDLARRGRLDRWQHYLSMHYLYRWADAILVPSRGAAADLATFAGIAPTRVQVVPSPLVTEELRTGAEQPPEHPWLMDKTVPVILGAGELCERKDFESLIRAFARVRASRPCRLIVIGRGRRHQALRELAERLGVADDVDLPGFVSHPYVYMQHAALFVLTSTYEGFGNVLAEALALGTPVVSTDCPSGPREILQDGRYGPLVPVGDVDALVRAINETLDSPLPPDTLSMAAEPYTTERSAARYLQALGF